MPLLLLLFTLAVLTLHAKADSTAAQRTYRDTLTYQSRAVVVTGTRAEAPLERTPVRVEVISGTLAQTTAISTVGELLREQPGLVVSPGSVRSGVQLMGFTPDYTLILVDGQPLTGRVGGVIDLQRVSVGNVERVEVVRGPLSSLYGGDALAGVINIITKRPESGYSGRALARYLYHGAAEVQVEQSYGSPQFDLNVFGTVRRSWPFDVRQDSALFPFAGFDDYTLNARAWWNPLSRLKATLSARMLRSLTQGPLLQAQAGEISTVEGSLDVTDYSLGSGIEWLSSFGRWTLQLYGTAYREGYSFPAANGDPNTTSDSFERRTGRAFLQWDHIINARNRVMAGVELLYDDAGGTRYPDRPFYRTGAAFVQWEGNPTERLSYALSLRSDQTSAFGSPSSVLLGGLPLLPRLSLRYALSSAVALTATIGEGFKIPDMRQLFIRFSPAGVGYQLLGARVLGLSLAPEQALTAMAGTTVALDSQLLRSSALRTATFDVLLFFNRLRNMIEYFPYSQSPLVFSYRNVAAAQTYGVLLSAYATAALDVESTLSLGASYQWLCAVDERVLDAIERGSAGYMIPSTGEFRRLQRADYYGLWYRPFHTATLRLDWAHRSLALAANVRVQYIGSFGDQQLAATPVIYSGTAQLGQLLDNPRELVPPSWVVNCGVEKQLPIGAATLALSAGINNLLDVVRPQFLPSLIGRQGFATVQVRW